MNSKPTALISVYHKDGIVDFAKELVALGWQIMASRGTALVLHQAGLVVRDVADLVGGAPILGHRVVTLSREVHAGLLARDFDEDNQELERLGISRIDLVCVDLYPLSTEIHREGSTPESVLELTDIGGPTLLRSAAKGRRIVICHPEDRERVLTWLKADCPDREGFILSLANKAEATVAKYCLSSAFYQSQGLHDGVIGSLAISCRYGENAWQVPAGLYSCGSADPLSLDRFELVAGAPLSFNNCADLDRLLQTITHIAAAFEVNRGTVPLIAVGVKHGNACGACINTNPIRTLAGMIDGDTRAIFGGIVITNFPISEEGAEVLLTYNTPGNTRRLLDGVVAPDFDQAAVQLLRRKGDKCRFLVNPALANLGVNSLDRAPRFRYVRGGFLRQPNYSFVLNLESPGIERLGRSNPSHEEDLLLAWAVGSTSNSNTITIVKQGVLIGNGVGQQDRVGGCKLAVHRAREAGHPTLGAVAYSDSFFPFIDGPEVLAEAGIKAILSSSGSVRDGEVKKFCLDKGITLYLIPDSAGRGFFGH